MSKAFDKSWKATGKSLVEDNIVPGNLVFAVPRLIHLAVH